MLICSFISFNLYIPRIDMQNLIIEVKNKVISINYFNNLLFKTLNNCSAKWPGLYKEDQLQYE